MSRRKKLLFAGLVLVVGFGAAWPFRHKSVDRSTVDRSTADRSTTDPPNAGRGRESMAKPQSLDFGRVSDVATWENSGHSLPMGSPAPQVVAKMTGWGDAKQRNQPTTSFDFANHPALATSLAPRTASPVTPPLPPEIPSLPTDSQRTQKPRTQGPRTQQGSKPPGDSRPAYAISEHDRMFEQEAEVRHVVQNTDTLEKLAKRYLGDEGRSLEIFDLNRDVLDNPHLLPIDAELRIPVHPTTDD